MSQQSLRNVRQRRRQLTSLLRSIEQRINLLVVAFLLFVLGLALLVLLPSATLIGGAVLGAGLSALVATATGREAIRQQYAKEANLRRKDDLYAPLHAEIKYLRERLEAAAAGTSAYPLQINTELEPTKAGRTGRSILFCQLWPQYRQDARKNAFSPRAGQLLDLLVESADTYSKHIDTVRAYVLSILARHADEAITGFTRTSEFTTWQQAVRENRQCAATVTNIADHEWYNMVEQALSLSNLPSHAQSDTPGTILAEKWLASERSPRGRDGSFLWLLAGSATRAAEHAQSNYGPAGMEMPLLMGRLEPIFQAGLEELQTQPLYQEVQAALHDVLHQARAAEELLEQGLLRIQELYEGGAPLI